MHIDQLSLCWPWPARPYRRRAGAGAGAGGNLAWRRALRDKRRLAIGLDRGKSLLRRPGRLEQS